jgi:hypothetical protein
MKSRRHFLKEVCPTVAFAFFGLSFLEACSSGDDDVASTSSGTGNGSNVGGGNDSSGFTVDGNTYTIDLTNSNFSNISTVGGWMNGKEIGIPALFLRISSSVIQAYSNVCTTHGKNDRWELKNNGSEFNCKHANTSFSTDCDNSSSLTCYNPDLDGNTLILTI